MSRRLLNMISRVADPMIIRIFIVRFSPDTFFDLELKMEVFEMDDILL